MNTLDLRTLTDRELHDYVRATCVEMVGRLGVPASAVILEGGLALVDEALRLNALVGQQ